MNEATEIVNDNQTKQTVWEKIEDLKKEAGEAAFNEKVYLLLRMLLKEEKYFDESVDFDNEIKNDCNKLFNTWSDYLDADNDTNFENLKDAYLTCEPKVERKLKNYVGRRSGEMATKAKDYAIRTGERAQQLGNQAIVEARKRKAQILEKSRQFSKSASSQYKNAHDRLIQTAEKIKEKIKHLKGDERKKAADAAIADETKTLVNVPEQKELTENLENIVNNDTTESTTSNPSAADLRDEGLPFAVGGGARLTRKRKRKRKRKKRKTRRNRKLN